jgi:acetyl-CoA carboxylase biotin carboxyl carrier protein
LAPGGRMDRRKIEELIRLVEDSDVAELTVSGLFGSIRIVKSGPAIPTVTEIESAPVAATPPARSEEATDVEAQADDRDSGLVPIVSPMVGTFYAAPSPEAAAFVRQGDRVSKGQVVCIVEAMKLMNEIESEVSGTIVRVAVENAQPVEFGQALFLVEPD